MSIDLRSFDGGTSESGQPQMFSTHPRFRTVQKRGHLPLQTVPVHGPHYDVARDVLGLKTGISNVYFIGAPGSAAWVLVDAGMPGSANKIIATAEKRFGRDVPPAAIILTHGHFDHVGALKTLLERWEAPVYAHALEMPYLTGQSSYPPPDPSVGGGAMAWMSTLYPKKPIDLGIGVRPLYSDGSILQLPDWRWLDTPGHSPGHISLFRDDDRTLIAGDAFVTIKAESMLANVTLKPELHGPPSYFTPDWVSSRVSVQVLADLDPETVATGHGIPLRGSNMREELHQLAFNFDFEAMPSHGRYVHEAAQADEHGIRHVPPHYSNPRATIGWMLGIAAGGWLLGFLLGQLLPKRRDPNSWRSLMRRARR